MSANNKLFIFISAFIFCVVFLSAPEIRAEINLKAMALIESSNNPQAVSFLGAKYGRGLHQISEIALKDFNSANPKKYSPDQLFNPAVNTEIANWLLNVRIPQILKANRLPLSEENILTCYNMGCGAVKKNKRAETYIKKYRRALNVHTR